MSEFQAYEFRALDRALTKKQMDELRELSSRAEITPHRFSNNYSYGSARFDPKKLIEKYFDVFLYLSNWGTHRFMVRVPRDTFALKTLEDYFVDDLFDGWVSGDNLILSFTANIEDGGGWVGDDESELLLDIIVDVREELLKGDLRPVYLGWLATRLQDRLDDDEDAPEPPVPPGLGQLSESLKALAEFLWTDENLLDVAAQVSPKLVASGEGSPAEKARWIAALPIVQKEKCLLRTMEGEGNTVGRELMREFQSGRTKPQTSVVSGRTSGQLLQLWEDWAAEQERRAAAKKAREKAAKAKKDAAERDQYLDTIVGREVAMWTEIETAIQTSKPKEYDRAITLLKDLRDLAARAKQADAFRTKFAELRTKYGRRSALVAKFRTLQESV